jgi:hypothetical protein
VQNVIEGDYGLLAKSWFLTIQQYQSLKMMIELALLAEN